MSPQCIYHWGVNYKYEELHNYSKKIEIVSGRAYLKKKAETKNLVTLFLSVPVVIVCSISENPQVLAAVCRVFALEIYKKDCRTKLSLANKWYEMIENDKGSSR